MPSSLDISCLPLEVLRLVFETLPKDDRKICLLVNKTWFHTAQVFFSRDISIRVGESSLSKLLQDIPYFAHTITSITLRSKYLRLDGTLKTDRTSDAVVLEKILSSCPNLISLNFNFAPITDYLKALRRSRTNLKSIQKIYNPDFDVFNRDRILYLKVNLQYRATITSLHIFSMRGAPKDALSQYVSYFPKLTHLKANVRTVDISRLLRAAPLLQSLDCEANLLIVSRTEDTTEPPEHLHLKSLKLWPEEAEIHSIQYITTRLKQVKSLSLDIVRVRSDVYTEEESKRLFNDLEEYTIGMDSALINYQYNRDYRSLKSGFKPILIKVSDHNSFSVDDDSAKEIPSFLSPGSDDDIYSDNKIDSNSNDGYVASNST